MRTLFKELSWRRASDSSKTEKLKLNEFPAGATSQAMSEAARELGQPASYPTLKLCAHINPYSKELSSVRKWVLSRMLAPQTAGLSLVPIIFES